MGVCFHNICVRDKDNKWRGLSVGLLENSRRFFTFMILTTPLMNLKHLIPCIHLFLLVSYSSFAQTKQQQRILFENLGDDSVNLHFNSEYRLIEDSCAAIIRYAHYSFQRRVFYGKFKDVAKDDPAIIIAEGTYNTAGLKDGDFITHYLNGNLRAKVSFKNNNLDGECAMYYEDGRPALSFEANNGDCRIIEQWDMSGRKTIDNGNGAYKVSVGYISWTGKLVNGKPDGKWEAISTMGADKDKVLVKEKFNNGVFQKGNNQVGDYTEASRIVLVNTDELSFITAERLFTSYAGCNAVKRKTIVNARFPYGTEAYSNEINQLVSSYLGKQDLSVYSGELAIEGAVLENGYIGDLSYRDFTFDKIGRGLINALRQLSALEPALIDGKAAKQKIIFTFNFSGNVYSFKYRLLPLN